jgi:hypothetical protein
MKSPQEQNDISAMLQKVIREKNSQSDETFKSAVEGLNIPSE